MSTALVEQIAEAVLYEGYVLYPYRPSSKKNQRQRFTFGRVCPQDYSIAENGAEPCIMQTECLAVASSESAQLSVSARFLQPVAREIGALADPARSLSTDGLPSYQVVPELRAGGKLFQTWHEARERKVAPPPVKLGKESLAEYNFPFEFEATRDVEPIREGDLIVGLVLRTSMSVQGVVTISVQQLQNSLSKITVGVLNQTPWTPHRSEMEAVLLRTFASTHLVLQVQAGQFVSLMDPPAELRDAAAQCRNVGAWPVLVGDEAKGERDVMLSSPVILYDYPRIAEESPGPLFDGTEIDEILTLRILTLSDEEKLELSQADTAARQLLERTESLPREAFARLHGTVRDLQPTPAPAVEYDDFFGARKKLTEVKVQGLPLRVGDHVRIRPKARADIMDMALSGQLAVIEALEQDLEERVHLALVLENDPGKDLGLMRQPGHRFFFGLDEVEPVLEGTE